ncbi:hypothetical protein NBRC110019_18190 [Neptunitalea chrysea]|uniref:Uncharacterized protein n=1 Tax=Neptunitalea chrysea TaxID=1647581 RepID=A0A9W6B573_9FLAO|nr:hypothetical protein [Neptunitalea chrysea]GLB52779.1 hypothetical protein NBRC110019_18190 [Neptunitalea chrysea]
MTINELPFKLGMHYENWELVVEIEDLNTYQEKYKYLKGDIQGIHKIKVKEIFLYFRFDFLFGVEIVFDTSSLKDIFTILEGTLNATYGLPNEKTDTKEHICCIWINKPLKVTLLHNLHEDKVYLQFTKRNFIILHGTEGID